MLQIHYVRNILNLEYPTATISTLSQFSIFKILQINDISYLNHFPFSTYRAQKIVHYISLQACIFYAFNILDLTNNFLIARVQYSFKIILVENMQQNRDWLHPKKRRLTLKLVGRTRVEERDDLFEALSQLHRTCYRLLKVEELPTKQGGSLRGFRAVHDSIAMEGISCGRMRRQLVGESYYANARPNGKVQVKRVSGFTFEPVTLVI